MIKTSGEGAGEELSSLSTVRAEEKCCTLVGRHKGAGRRIYLGPSNPSNWRVDCCPHSGQIFAFVFLLTVPRGEVLLKQIYLTDYLLSSSYSVPLGHFILSWTFCLP